MEILLKPKRDYAEDHQDMNNNHSLKMQYTNDVVYRPYMKLDISMSVYHNEYNIFTVYISIHTCMHL